jgi:hypothetical protein
MERGAQVGHAQVGERAIAREQPDLRVQVEQRVVDRRRGQQHDPGAPAEARQLAVSPGARVAEGVRLIDHD